MFCVSCLSILWRHDIWISEKVKFDYLYIKKSFQNEIKKHFSLFLKCSFLDIQKKLAKKLGMQPFKIFFDFSGARSVCCSVCFFYLLVSFLFVEEFFEDTFVNVFKRHSHVNWLWATAETFLFWNMRNALLCFSRNSGYV